MDALRDLIDHLNNTYGLEIDLACTEEIYGADMLQSMADMAAEVAANIEYLVDCGFDETVSDICNRFAPSLMDDSWSFREKVDGLLASLGHDAIEQLREDMSPWEELM